MFDLVCSREVNLISNWAHLQRSLGQDRVRVKSCGMGGIWNGQRWGTEGDCFRKVKVHGEGHSEIEKYKESCGGDNVSWEEVSRSGLAGPRRAKALGIQSAEVHPWTNEDYWSHQYQYRFSLVGLCWWVHMPELFLQFLSFVSGVSIHVCGSEQMYFM